MARQNLVFLYGAVANKPLIYKKEDGDYIYGLAIINVVRGVRDVGDHKRHMKCDNPYIMSRDPLILKEMESWEQYDMVEVKGMIAAKTIRKGSICTGCGEKNVAEGAFVYVEPIFAMRRGHCEDLDACMKELSKNREISNQAYVFGTLCKNPERMSPMSGLVLTQYQIALNRKYRIRSDPPEIRTDYPWVKSYGANAEEDATRLHVGSTVFVDGCLQARSVNRHAVCSKCGKKYDWKDRAMEIVPYETEYVSNFYTDEQLSAQKAEKLEKAKKENFGFLSTFDDEEDEEV